MRGKKMDVRCDVCGWALYENDQVFIGGENTIIHQRCYGNRDNLQVKKAITYNQLAAKDPKKNEDNKK